MLNSKPTFVGMFQSITTRLPAWHWLIIGLLTLAYTWVYCQEMLASPLRVNDDMVQHYLWLIVDHFDLNWKDMFYADASAAIQPRGFYYLLWLLGRVFEPLTISRGGPFLISLLTVGYGVALLRQYTHIFIAVAGSLLAIHLGFATSAGFLARSFLMPLILAFGYYLLRGDRPWGTVTVVVASALFYPPALLINGGIWGLWKLGGIIIWWRGRRMQSEDEGKVSRASPLRNWYVYLLGFGLALVIVLAHSRRIETHPTLGGYLPNTELLSQPEFSGKGRVNIGGRLTTPPLNILAYFFVHSLKSPLGHWPAYPIVLLTLLLTFVKWKTGDTPYYGLSTTLLPRAQNAYQQPLSKLGAWLIATGIITAVLYFIAREVFPLLFLPDRYLVYPWRLWAALLYTFLLAVGWSYFPKTWLAALFGVFLLAFGYSRQSPAELPVSNEDGRDKIFAAISTLPEDALVMVPPHIAEQVPVFTHRNVFLSRESAHALYFQNYHAYIMPRFHDFVEAYTSTDESLNTMLTFLDKWDIDYFMVDRKQLQEGWLMGGFEPFQSQFKDRLEETELSERALLNLPDSLGQLIQDRLHLLSREDVRELATGRVVDTLRMEE